MEIILLMETFLLSWPLFFAAVDPLVGIASIGLCSNKTQKHFLPTETIMSWPLYDLIDIIY